MSKAFALFTVIIFSVGAISFIPPRQKTFYVQPDHATTPRTISAKDKAAINDIFKTIGVRNFRMEFENNEAYGAYKLQDVVVKFLRSGSYIDADILVTEDLYKSYQPQLAFWFYINRNRSEGFEGIFGKSNAARLEAIIKKYSGGQ